MDGFELCRNLKSDERTSHIPIILLTARAGTESRIEGLETGADDFISKPFDSDELLVRIKNLIAQRNRLQKRFLKNIVTLGISPLLHLDTPDLTSMDQRFLQKAVKLVMDHIADPEFNVDTFGASISLSRRQLHRKLIALTGHPPSQFIRSLRLSRAAGLIAKKTGTITEIAYEVGFNNLSYFARCFQEEFGCTPSEYGNPKFQKNKFQANSNL
jgi:AraC-like DNA-binding protein